MMKTLTLLMRGTMADNAQAIHDANAVAILRQQVRDVAGTLAAARREVAVAMAYQAAEVRVLDVLGSRIASVSDAARKALADGREGLGRDAAVLIAALQDEQQDRQSAIDKFEADIGRLKALVGQGQDRLRDLDRGLQTARSSEAVRRAGINSRQMVAMSAGPLSEAEQTLARLRDRQRRDDDFVVAMTTLDSDHIEDVETRLDDQGYGRRRTDPQSILDQLKASV